MQHKTDREQGAVDRIHSPTSHLYHPVFGGMSGECSQGDATRLQVQKEQHIIGCQPAPGEYLHREKIDACQYRHVRTDEVGPTHLLSTLGSRSNTKAA